MVGALLRLSALPKVYHSLGDRHLAGRVRITQSIYAALAGQQELALRVSGEGLAQIDGLREPRLLMTALHNRLLLLHALGHREEAGRTLAQCKSLKPPRELCAVSSRLWWMAGRVWHDLGDHEPAEAILRVSRNCLLALRLGHFSAMASLDLAATLLRLGKKKAGRNEVEVAQIICDELKDRPDLANLGATLKLLPQNGVASAELLEKMLASLRRGELERAA